MKLAFETKLIVNKLPNLIRELHDTAADIIDISCDFLIDEIETSWLLEKSGRLYGSHRASAPGEAPAIWHGELSRSLTKRKIGLHGTVSVFSKYAALLEFGTVKMAARPYMGPAAEKLKDNLEAIAKQRFKVTLDSL